MRTIVLFPIRHSTSSGFEVSRIFLTAVPLLSEFEDPFTFKSLITRTASPSLSGLPLLSFTFGASKISAAIDVIDNKVIIKARKKFINHDPLEYAKLLENMGVKRVIVTDVSKNGMLQGANIELSKLVALNTNLKVTHSGGITNYTDLIELSKFTDDGIDSVIIGRALYENRFACQKLWRVAEAGLFD